MAAPSSSLQDPSPRLASWLARLTQGHLLAFYRAGYSSSRRPGCSANPAGILKALGLNAGTFEVLGFGILKAHPLLQRLPAKATQELLPVFPRDHRRILEFFGIPEAVNIRALLAKTLCLMLQSVQQTPCAQFKVVLLAGEDTPTKQGAAGTPQQPRLPQGPQMRLHPDHL